MFLAVSSLLLGKVEMKVGSGFMLRQQRFEFDCSDEVYRWLYEVAHVSSNGQCNVYLEQGPTISFKNSYQYPVTSYVLRCRFRPL